MEKKTTQVTFQLTASLPHLYNTLLGLKLKGARPATNGKYSLSPNPELLAEKNGHNFVGLEISGSYKRKGVGPATTPKPHIKWL